MTRKFSSCPESSAFSTFSGMRGDGFDGSSLSRNFETIFEADHMSGRKER
jgi:hypothetical protein